MFHYINYSFNFISPDKYFDEYIQTGIMITYEISYEMSAKNNKNRNKSFTFTNDLLVLL